MYGLLAEVVETTGAGIAATAGDALLVEDVTLGASYGAATAEKLITRVDVYYLHGRLQIILFHRALFFNLYCFS